MLIGQNILIMGGTGSLGNELTSSFGQGNTIGIFSRDENKQWTMKRKYPTAKFFIGDVKDKTSMVRAITGFRPNIIIFAAAQKHIDICEREVSESVNTNILGIRNLIEILELRNDPALTTVLFISTDKACNPINVYGQCKSISEKLMFEASKIVPRINFICVRYGNVINSRGSLVPLFEEIAHDDNKICFPVTDERMTRFFMSISQAVTLIETSIIKGNSGEIWIHQVPSLFVIHIARYFSEKYNKPISIVGIRPGEKLHEELYSITEESKSRRHEDFIVITPLSTENYSKCSGLSSNTYAIEDYNDAVIHIYNMVQHGTF